MMLVVPEGTRLTRLPPRLRKRISVEGDCWIWTGRFQRGQPIIHHRSAASEIWKALNGKPWPEGMVATVGACLERACVRHRVMVPNGQHTRLGYERGLIERDATFIAAITAERRRRSPFDMEIARSIRRMAAEGVPPREIAAQHGTSVEMTRRIVRNVAWVEMSAFCLSGLVQQARKAAAPRSPTTKESAP